MTTSKREHVIGADVTRRPVEDVVACRRVLRRCAARRGEPQQEGGGHRDRKCDRTATHDGATQSMQLRSALCDARDGSIEPHAIARGIEDS
jgi:hypothetical protein